MKRLISTPVAGSFTSWAQHVNARRELAAHSLELFLLNKTAGIVVQDPENLLHVLGALLGEATQLEELLGAEGVWS